MSGPTEWVPEPGHDPPAIPNGGLARLTWSADGTFRVDRLDADPLTVFPTDHKAIEAVYLFDDRACPRRHVTLAGVVGWLVVTVTIAYFGAHLLVAAGVGR